MLNPKQKAYLKSLAQKIKATHQLGKDGLSDNFLYDVNNYINKYELIKITILKNSDLEIEDIIAFFEENGMEFVEHKGRTVVLYKPALEPQIKLPK